MPYTALPDRRIPYDNDGTVVGYRNGAANNDFSFGLSTYLSQATLLEMNDDDSAFAIYLGGIGGGAKYGFLYLFFPESREITGIVITYIFGSFDTITGAVVIQGSADSTNGVDGTWETASVGANPQAVENLDNFRALIRSVSLTGSKRSMRISVLNDSAPVASTQLARFHLYGEKAAGQTPNDIIFIDHDTTPGVEFTAPEDFGDRPLGTTVTRQFRVKNASTTLTANTINIQCNDPDFTISTDGTTWVVTINIASLAAGAESATMFVRNTTPAPGNLLGPRFARIVATCGSWT